MPGAEPYYQEYLVPYDEGTLLSIMNVLEYIYDNLDSTLAFFHHAACMQAACGKCLVRANGKPVLACVTRVTGEDLLLEPAKEQFVRDLVVR